MAVAGSKLNTKPAYLVYDEQDRTTDFPTRTKPVGKRYAGYLKRNRPYTEYLNQMTQLHAASEVPDPKKRGVIPNGSVLAAQGGTGDCRNMTLDQCYAAGQAFPKFGHMFSQEGEGAVVLTPKADVIQNGISNAQRHKRYYEGIMDSLPDSDYWFFGNYGSLYFSYSNESFQVEGGAQNALQSKFTNMYANLSDARAAFKQYYPNYYNMGMNWHAHVYVRSQPNNGLEHSTLHMLLVGKKAFPDRKGSLFFWPPIESTTGGAFSVNHSFGSKTTNPAGDIYMWEHAVLPADTCRNLAFIGYMEVEALTTFEDGYRPGEDRNVRGAGGTQYRPIPDTFRPAGGGTGTFPYQENAPNRFPRQPWWCSTATTHGVDLAVQAVNFLGGSHASYTSEFCKFRLDGGAWTTPRSDGADVLYQRGADTTVNGLKVSSAKPICRVSKGASGKRVVWFMDPDGPMGGKRKLEVELDGTIYDLGQYEARDLHIQCFSVGSVITEPDPPTDPGTTPPTGVTLVYNTNHNPPNSPSEYVNYLDLIDDGITEGANAIRICIRIGEWIKANGNYSRWDQHAALATSGNRNLPILLHIICGFNDDEFPSWLTTDMCQRFHDNSQTSMKVPSLEWWKAWEDGVGYDSSNPAFRIEGVARQIIQRYGPQDVSWGLSETCEFQYSHRNGPSGVEAYSGCETRADNGLSAYTNGLYTTIPNPLGTDINDSFGTNDDKGRRSLRYRTLCLERVKRWGMWIHGANVTPMLDCGAYNNSQSVLIGSVEVKRLSTGIKIVKVNAMPKDDWRELIDYLAQLAAQGMEAIEIEHDFSLFRTDLSTSTPGVSGRWTRLYTDTTEVPRTTTNINSSAVYNNFTRAIDRGLVRGIGFFGMSSTNQIVRDEYIRCIHALDGRIGIPIKARPAATATINATVRKLRKAFNEGAWQDGNWDSIGRANIIDFNTIEESF